MARSVETTYDVTYLTLQEYSMNFLRSFLGGFGLSLKQFWAESWGSPMQSEVWGGTVCMAPGGPGVRE